MSWLINWMVPSCGEETNESDFLKYRSQFDKKLETKEHELKKFDWISRRLSTLNPEGLLEDFHLHGYVSDDKNSLITYIDPTSHKKVEASFYTFMGDAEEYCVYPYKFINVKNVEFKDYNLLKNNSEHFVSETLIGSALSEQVDKFNLLEDSDVSTVISSKHLSRFKVAFKLPYDEEDEEKGKAEKETTSEEGEATPSTEQNNDVAALSEKSEENEESIKDTLPAGSPNEEKVKQE